MYGFLTKNVKNRTIVRTMKICGGDITEGKSRLG
jgi:hypothetical protein